MKKIFLIFLLATLTLTPKLSNAKTWWGPVGHGIVAKLALQWVTPEVRQNVLNILGGMSADTAGSWMDIMRANPDYDFMKPWHYIDFDKGKAYEPSTEENIVNRIIIAFNELRHKKVLCAEQIRFDMLVLFHLVGDLHQPLHTGYPDDLGGNKVAIQFDTLKANLHHFWDEDIIRLNNITMEDCIAYYEGNKNIDTIEGIHPVSWMKESRSLLDGVYDYPGFTLSDDYVKKNGLIVKKQLVLAGLRLAAILNKLFVSDAAVVNMKEVASRYKDGIDVADAAKYIGKNVTACGKVFGVKTTDKVTFINVGAAYPNSPMTVVIFAADRAKFGRSLEELFNGKNICVHGEVVDYQGKAEIIVTKPGEIEVMR